MFESRYRGGGGSSANRWLIVAGAGLVILAFVARMLLDIGHTKVSDLAGVLRPDTAKAAASSAPAPAPADTVGADTFPAPPAAAQLPAATPPDTATNPASPAPPATPPKVSTSQATASPGSAPSSTAPTGTHVTVAKPPPVLRMDTTTPGSRYVVQIGAFGSEANAAKLGQRASALGYEATVVPQVRGDATLYLVRVVRAGSPADARIVSDSLANTLGVKAVVLRPDQ
jgi:DedD protein